MVRKTIDTAGTIRYINEQNQYHRIDGPAIEYIDGTKFYIINDLYHKVDGPAMEYPDGSKNYYLMDEEYSYEDWLSIKDFPLLW